MEAIPNDRIELVALLDELEAAMDRYKQSLDDGNIELAMRLWNHCMDLRRQLRKVAMT